MFTTSKMYAITFPKVYLPHFCKSGKDQCMELSELPFLDHIQDLPLASIFSLHFFTVNTSTQQTICGFCRAFRSNSAPK